jgi:hypothetical protein
MSSNRSDRIYSNLRNEFLRFNDLKPSTKPLPFWILFVAFSAALLVPLIISNLLPESADLAVRLFAAAYLALSAFLLIPGTALFLRRYADLSIFQTLLQRFADFQRRNLIGARVAKIAGWLLLGSIVLLAAWVNAGITALALIILAAFPTSSAPLEQPKSKVMPSAPTLPTLNRPSQSVLPLTAAAFAAPNPTAAYRSDLVSPSKDLTSRAGFWLSLALAILVFFFSMFPNALSNLEAPSLFEEPQQTSSPSPSPTPLASTQSLTVSPTTSMEVVTESATTSVLVDAGVGAGAGSDNDDGLVVVPLTSDEEVVEADLLDPRFRYCTHAIGAGYGPYYAGVDPEYGWYFDRDGDGIVCER